MALNTSPLNTRLIVEADFSGSEGVTADRAYQLSDKVPVRSFCPTQRMFEMRGKEGLLG